MLCIEMFYSGEQWNGNTLSHSHMIAGSMIRLPKESMDSGKRCECIPSGESNKEGLDPGQGHLRECWWFLEMKQLSGMDVGCVWVF
jgi:hypothetical protein